MVDGQTQEIVAIELTTNFVGDPEKLPESPNHGDDQDAIAKIADEGTYDAANCYEAIRKEGRER